MNPDARCDVHREHYPRPLLFEQHHIWPLGMQGPDTADNQVWICVQGHYNVHHKLAELIRDGVMSKGGGREERRLAQQGYDAWINAGKPGRPVYEARPVHEH